MVKSKAEILRYVCIATIALAGVVHLLISPTHYAHAPAHGIFFAVVGLAQIVWAIAFWRQPSLNLFRAGLVLSGGLITLWLLTQIFFAPFGDGGPEPVDASTLICKSCELIGLITLVALVLLGQTFNYTASTSRLIGEALTLSLITGLFFWGIGYVAHPLWPQLGHQHEAEHPESAPPHEHDSTPSTTEHVHDDPAHEHTDEHQHEAD